MTLSDRVVAGDRCNRRARPRRRPDVRRGGGAARAGREGRRSIGERRGDGRTRRRSMGAGRRRRHRSRRGCGRGRPRSSRSSGRSTCCSISSVATRAAADRAFNDDDLRSMLDQHLWSTLHVGQGRRAGHGRARVGSVVAVSATTARRRRRGSAAYSVAKAAEEALLRTIGREVAGSGVTVNVLVVRKIDTEHERDTAPSPKNAPVDDAGGAGERDALPLLGRGGPTTGQRITMDGRTYVPTEFAARSARRNRAPQDRAWAALRRGPDAIGAGAAQDEREQQAGDDEAGPDRRARERDGDVMPTAMATAARSPRAAARWRWPPARHQWPATPKTTPPTTAPVPQMTERARASADPEPDLGHRVVADEREDEDGNAGACSPPNVGHRRSDQERDEQPWRDRVGRSCDQPSGNAPWPSCVSAPVASPTTTMAPTRCHAMRRAESTTIAASSQERETGVDRACEIGWAP